MQLLAEVRKVIESKKMLDNPFYQAWMTGSLTMAQLQNYATQYVPFVEAFPRFVSATHSLCNSPKARQMLVENLMDEEGLRNSPPHPELWQGFAAGIGADPQSAAPIMEKAQALQETFFALSQSSYEEGLCALYAYESQIPEVSKAKIEGLARNYGISDAGTVRFFSLHQEADVFHSRACEQMINEIPPESYDKALAATQRATEAIWDFLTEAHQQRVHH